MRELVFTKSGRAIHSEASKYLKFKTVKLRKPKIICSWFGWAEFHRNKTTPVISHFPYNVQHTSFDHLIKGSSCALLMREKRALAT